VPARHLIRTNKLCKDSCTINLALLHKKTVSIKRVLITVGILAPIICYPVIHSKVGHWYNLWKHDGVSCAKLNPDGSVKFYRYGLYCDPDWARQQGGV
jgi:hypothetical protein